MSALADVCSIAASVAVVVMGGVNGLSAKGVGVAVGITGVGITGASGGKVCSGNAWPSTDVSVDGTTVDVMTVDGNAVTTIG